MKNQIRYTVIYMIYIIQSENDKKIYNKNKKKSFIFQKVQYNQIVKYNEKILITSKVKIYFSLKDFTKVLYYVRIYLGCQNKKFKTKKFQEEKL